MIAPLSQVLEQRTGVRPTTYRYGHERPVSVQDGTRTWYGTDALGSVRQTLTGGGTATAAINYDPWGTPTQGTPPTFGFTGEWQDGASGLVHLRARWYLPGEATFVSRDPFAGFPTAPTSLHPYQYGYNNPALYTDPTGRYVYRSGVCVDEPQPGPAPIPYGHPVPTTIPCLPEPLTTEQKLDMTQTYLDMYGNVPVIGEPIDAVNGGIYLYRGDYANATMSFCSMIPLAGSAFSGTRLARRFGRVGGDILEYGPDIIHNAPLEQIDEIAPPYSRGYHGDGPRGNTPSNGGSSSPLDAADAIYPPVTYIDPSELRWTQRTAGGRGRADAMRRSMMEKGYEGAPIDVVRTVDGLTTVDHTRATVALELGIDQIPARIHLPDESLPSDMIGRFGNARTWGEAAAYRAANQRPPLPPTGTPNPPRLPRPE